MTYFIATILSSFKHSIFNIFFNIFAQFMKVSLQPTLKMQHFKVHTIRFVT